MANVCAWVVLVASIGCVPGTLSKESFQLDAGKFQAVIDDDAAVFLAQLNADKVRKPKDKLSALEPEPVHARPAQADFLQEGVSHRESQSKDEARLFQPLPDDDQHQRVDIQDKDMLPEIPAGSDIWNSTKKWVKVSQWHPAGVLSNLGSKYGQLPIWNDVSFVSLYVIILLSAVAYPVLFVGVLILFTVLIGMCLVVDENCQPDEISPPQPAADPECEIPHGSEEPQGDETLSGLSNSNPLQRGRLHLPIPVIPKSSLTAASQRIYSWWALFCCAVPSLLVFGTPCLMVGFSRPYPQEVLASLTLLTSAFIFSNGIYMVVFAGRGVMEMRLAQSIDYSRLLASEQHPQVLHWVILPQYKEDVEVVAMALRSIAQSSIASSMIGIVLAMEAREEGAEKKVEELTSRFQGQFRSIVATYHPAGLPNDPPGKASNLHWAFKELLAQMGSEQEMAKVVLTVADADSEFSIGYFESLACHFLQEAPATRYCRIWQSPVFHVKNYNRQPAPVVVGTLFTAMQEMAALCDPNAVRFPYSSYSLSMNLARRVGGWDAEWIAEDYHMGIKCFLMTFGETTVEPVMLPTVNYVPEVEGSWWGTCMARWTQAKRHALGFSDFSYYFMMLPLVFSSTTTFDQTKDGRTKLRNFWKMLSYGSTLIIRLVNVHVVAGVLTAYGVLEFVLKLVMRFGFGQDRNLDFFFLRMGQIPTFLLAGSVGCTLVVVMIFIQAYRIVEHRIEGQPMFKNPVLHWLKNSVYIALFSPMYFFMLGFAIWKAAFEILTRSSFDYEVAPKPVTAAPENAATEEARIKLLKGA